MLYLVNRRRCTKRRICRPADKMSLSRGATIQIRNRFRHPRVLRSPTRFRDPGNQPLGRAFAKGDSGEAETPDETATTTTLLTTINQAGWTGVARKLGKPFVVALGLQFGPKCGILLYGLLLALIPFDPSFLRHKRAGKVPGNQPVAMENLGPSGKPGREIL